MKVAHLSEPAEECVIFRDGLGVRERRGTNAGEVLEWFHLDPAFAGAEQPLRERVLRLAKFQHVKFARIVGLEPAGKGRGPILVSSHVAGTRLADILEMAGHGLIAFDPGAGLQVTREVLGGLAVLHDSRNVSHGALGPERVVLTATGRVVMVEHVLAQALDRLQRPRHQLWRDWRIPTPPAAGPVRLDMQTDLAQAGVLALAALLGRPIDENEYPHRLRGLLPLAQDRLARSPAAGIAGDVIAWLERLAPVDSRRAFKTVREAQQAFEALVSGSASAMGISPARVKSAVAAITAIAPAPAALDTPPSPATEAPPAVVALPVATPAESDHAAADAEIDIEALLRLEAELEGGTSPVDPVTTLDAQLGPSVEAPSTPTVMSSGRAPSLEALAQERLELERQFAELVATVAPQEEAPVHLIPEVPATSEPLVAARVLWSSMPSDDLAESIETLQEALPPQGLAPDPLRSPSEPADEWSTFAPAPAQPDAEIPVSTPADAPYLAEPAKIASPVPEEAPATFETSTAPTVGPTHLPWPEEVRPVATSDSGPASWWTDALPWRAENRVAAAQDVASAVESPWPGAEVETTAVDADEANAPVPDAAIMPFGSELAGLAPATADLAADHDGVEWAAAGAFAPGVGEDFGYVSLEEAAGAGLDAPVSADDVIHEDEATSPAVEYRLFADIAPVERHEEAEAEPAEADAPVDLHWSDAALLLVGLDEVPGEPVAEVVAQEEAPPALVPDTVPLEAMELEIEPGPGLDASVTADETPGRDDAAASADEDRLLSDIAPVVLEEAAVDDEAAAADAPDALDHDDAPPMLVGHPAATAVESQDEPVVARAAVDVPGVADEAPREDEAVAPTREYIRVADIAPAAVQEDAGVEAPSAHPLFGLSDLGSAPVTAAASLLSREAPPDTTPDWRSTFLGGTPAEESVAEEPRANAGSASTPPPQPEPPLALEALALPVEPAPLAADDPAAWDGFAPELAAEPEPLAQPRPEEPAQPEPAVPVPDTIPTIVIVDDGAERDAWDDLPSEAWAIPAVTASVARKKKKRSRRRKGAATDVLGMPPAIAAEVVSAMVVAVPATPAPRVTDDDGHAVTVSGSSLLAREVPTWTPPADLGIRRPLATVPAVDPSTQSEESRRTGEQVPSPTRPVAVPPPLSVASTVEVVRPITAASPSPAPRPSEDSGAFEQEIRAVGMPDLEDLAPHRTRPAITSMADGIGTATGSSSRVVPFEPRVVVAAPEASRGTNWRRMMVASVLIALFQGAAFAAWWWVQPGARGTLVVQTSKVGVEVLLDDKVVGRTPFREEVAPGRHRLGLRQGSTVREMPVEISVGVVTTQAIDWPSLTGGRGNLQVTSNPTGAKIFVNGKARGEAPLLLEDLPAGDQVLTLRSDAGSVTVTAMVVAGETTPLEVKIFAGWVLVDAPVEVNLLLNGREKIGSSMDGQILLPPGTHRLQAVNEGLGIRQWFTVTVEPGAVRRVPLRVAPGTLALQEEAEVFVDGTSAGTTPGTISIAPGTHDIAIRPVSGPERRQAMTVRSGQRIEF